MKIIRIMKQDVSHQKCNNENYEPVVEETKSGDIIRPIKQIFLTIFEIISNKYYDRPFWSFDDLDRHTMVTVVF